MKFETNLFLRTLIGEKKSRLLEEDARIPLRCSPEAADRIIQIYQELKALNSALSELKEEEKKQDNPSTTPIEAPATPRLPDDTANRIRKALGLYVDTLRKAAASVGELLQLLPDDKKLIQARFDAFRLIEQARQDLDEFNAAYPEEK